MLISAGAHKLNKAWVAAPYSDGSQLVAPLRADTYDGLDADWLLQGGVQSVGPHEWVMYKPRWGAFYQTRLEAFLREQAIDTLVFTGCNFPNYPRTSMYEASERDFRVVMVADCISGVYDRGVQEMQDIGVTVVNHHDVIRKVELVTVA